MATNLVILESPSKALTVKGYLGTNYKVIASIGHVRDLPKSTLGVDIENDFEAHYNNRCGNRLRLVLHIRRLNLRFNLHRPVLKLNQVQ